MLLLILSFKSGYEHFKVVTFYYIFYYILAVPAQHKSGFQYVFTVGALYRENYII
jgi:hypothetical protein